MARSFFSSNTKQAFSIDLVRYEFMHGEECVSLSFLHQLPLTPYCQSCAVCSVCSQSVNRTCILCIAPPLGVGLTHLLKTVLKYSNQHWDRRRVGLHDCSTPSSHHLIHLQLRDLGADSICWFTCLHLNNDAVIWKWSKQMRVNRV